jgi:predicted metal-dependent phosphoesterase TrpH
MRKELVNIQIRKGREGRRRRIREALKRAVINGPWKGRCRWTLIRAKLEQSSHNISLRGSYSHLLNYTESYPIV